MMTKSTIDNEERQNRLLLLQDFEQWRAETGSNSRMDYAQERGISLQYLINCLKWHHEACKRNDQNVMVANIGPKPKEFPTLVAVTKKAGPAKPASSVAEGAIRIRMRASSIDLSGDIAPTLLVQLLSTLGALNVL
jgi:hypothetical protein